MKIYDTELCVIGAGPAGMCAAIEAAKAGVKVIVTDENLRPGGQLFKQIHKFFGSEEHHAGVRGYNIGKMLLQELNDLNADVMLGTTAYGWFPNEGLGIIHEGKACLVRAQKYIFACGAQENYAAFPGSTLPGVMGAGAAQTMANVNRVLPGKKVVMVGSGNVGLIVSYQLMQGGADIAALVEAAPRITGYLVHAAKLSRAGVPIFTGHTISRIIGTDHVEAVETIALNEDFSPVPGTEKIIECDTVCLALGMNPMTELLWQTGVKFTYIRPSGGHVPVHDSKMETSVPGIYVAGDITGIEEASSAMEEGRLAGIACAHSLGYISDSDAERLESHIWERLNALRSGPFGEGRKLSKSIQLQEAESIVEGGAGK